MADDRPPGLQEHLIRHPDWPKRVARDYHDRVRTFLADGQQLDPIQKLGVLKQAMFSVGRAMSETRGGLDYLAPDSVPLTSSKAFRLLAAITQRCYSVDGSIA